MLRRHPIILAFLVSLLLWAALAFRILADVPPDFSPRPHAIATIA